MHSDWEYYYLNVNRISQSFDTIQDEIEKLNQFVKLISNYIKDKEQTKLSEFIIYNYNTLYQLLTNYDKQFNTLHLQNIFNNIHNQFFYNYYLQLPKRRNSTKLIVFYKYNNLVKNSNNKTLQNMFNKLKLYQIKTLIHNDQTSIIDNIQKLCCKFNINTSNIIFVCSDIIGIHIAHNISCGYIVGIQKEKKIEIFQYANMITDNVINLLKILNT